MFSQAHRKAIVDGSAKATPLKTLGLKGRGEVYIDGSSCVRFITRSSRFLRKDAEGLMAVLEAASSHSDRKLSGHVLIEKAPVCSKARHWLEEQGVTVETLY